MVQADMWSMQSLVFCYQFIYILFVPVDTPATRDGIIFVNTCPFPHVGHSQCISGALRDFGPCLLRAETHLPQILSANAADSACNRILLVLGLELLV